MKWLKTMILMLAMLVVASTTALAADFDWLKDLNVKAQLDPTGFRAQLSTRFQIGDAQINAVIGNVDKPADAYMVLKLGEMSKQPPEKVIKEYKAKKGKGWGALAQSLGIKPGSAEFKALKQGGDLDGREKGKDKTKGKGKKR